ncbi:MAG: nitroreductase family protein [Rikenellaceae bacterium]|jgi:nitroreductase|nr:nitroreductase family protein [Rikenellaceae bacterium]
MKRLLLLLMMAVVSLNLAAQDITLPVPHKTGGMPLMEALSKRVSSRGYTGKVLSNQQLSDLLWAAWGVNRADGKRTAGSSMNTQDIVLYVFMEKGAYRYDAGSHMLVKMADGDLRTKVCTQPFGPQAFLQIISVADQSKGRGDEMSKKIASATNAGLIAQNVYLYCASEGLNSVVYAGGIDRDAVASILKLGTDQWPVQGQAAGY